VMLYYGELVFSIMTTQTLALVGHSRGVCIYYTHTASKGPINNISVFDFNF